MCALQGSSVNLSPRLESFGGPRRKDPHPLPRASSLEVQPLASGSDDLRPPSPLPTVCLRRSNKSAEVETEMGLDGSHAVNSEKQEDNYLGQPSVAVMSGQNWWVDFLLNNSCADATRW